MNRMPRAAAKAHGVNHRVEGNLELQDDAVGVVQHRCRGVDVGGPQPIVGSLHDDDAVLAVGLDEDRRHAARRAGHDLHLRRLDALRLEVGDRRRPEETIKYNSVGETETAHMYVPLEQSYSTQVDLDTRRHSCDRGSCGNRCCSIRSCRWFLGERDHRLCTACRDQRGTRIHRPAHDKICGCP